MRFAVSIGECWGRLQTIVKTLTKLGGGLAAPDRAGVTPLEMARRNCRGAPDDPVLTWMTRSAGQLAAQQEHMATRKTQRRAA